MQTNFDRTLQLIKNEPRYTWITAVWMLWLVATGLLTLITFAAKYDFEPQNQRWETGGMYRSLFYVSSDILLMFIFAGIIFGLFAGIASFLLFFLVPLKNGNQEAQRML